MTQRPSIQDEDGLRLNTDARNVDGFLALRYQANGGAWASFSGSSFVAERGIGAELGADDGDARFWRYPHVARTIGVLSAGTGHHRSPFGGVGDVEASLGVDVGRSEIDAFSSADYDELDSFEDGEDRTLTLRLLADQSLGDPRDLRAAFTVSEIRHDEFLPDGDSRYRQRLWSGGLEHVWRFTGAVPGTRELSWSTGVAYDVAETRQSAGREPLDRIGLIGARVGFSAPLRDGNTVLHAGASRRGRFPSLRELYSGALDRFEPNPNLEAEKVIATEIGVTRAFERAEVQLTGFHHRVDDAVVRITLPDRKFQRVNRNELRSTGLEMLGRYSVGAVDLDGTLQLQRVRPTDTEADDTGRPENLPAVSGGMGFRWRAPARLVASTSVDYTGDQFALDLVTGDDAELEGAAIWDLSVSRAWGIPSSFGDRAFTTAEFRVSIDNVLDEALYDSIGLPQPGRRARFELQLR